MSSVAWRLRLAPRRKVRGRFWRMLSPRWASQPLSGDGAARRGGRWNAAGQAALYLSEDHGTAIAEYLQGLVRPGLLTPYDVASDAILDLADPAVRNAGDVDEALLTIDWRRVRDVEHGRPPSWDLAGAALRVGFHGLRVPSVQPQGANNLVLWRWGGQDGASVRTVDPSSDLPRDARSWS